MRTSQGEQQAPGLTPQQSVAAAQQPSGPPKPEDGLPHAGAQRSPQEPARSNSDYGDSDDDHGGRALRKVTCVTTPALCVARPGSCRVGAMAFGLEYMAVAGSWTASQQPLLSGAAQAVHGPAFHPACRCSADQEGTRKQTA